MVTSFWKRENFLCICYGRSQSPSTKVDMIILVLLVTTSSYVWKVLPDPRSFWLLMFVFQPSLQLPFCLLYRERAQFQSWVGMTRLWLISDFLIYLKPIFFFFLKHPLVCFYLSTVPQFPSPKDSLLWVRRLRQGPASQDIHLRMAGPRSFWSLVQCPFYVAVVKTTQESISQLNTKGHVSWGMCLIFNSHSCSFDHCSPQSPQQKDTQDERKKQKGGRGKKLQELNL